MLTMIVCSASAERPNIVFFLIDDLGYMDIGANNRSTFYQTPNIDRLASESVRFTNGYAACPVCSPTRFSILTGRYPTRVDATDWFTGRRTGRFAPAPLIDHMPLEEFTLAEALAAAGYQTAFIGKWHLGPTEEYWPEQQGFAINVAGHDRGSPPGGYFSPYRNPRLPSGPDGEYLTDRLTDETLRILGDFHEDGRPFLVYLSFYTVHTPLQAPAALVEKYRELAAEQSADQPEFAPEEQIWPTDKPRRTRVVQRHATYAAMVEKMDQNVGRVLNRLVELGVEKNTVVCFMSDNGGLATSEGSPTSNLPLRGGKGWLYEGGIREPMLIKCPNIAAGVCDEPVISTDFYPTLLDIADLPPRPEQHQDGVSLMPLLERRGTLDRDALFWHYPHYSNQGGFPGAAIRSGDWKLLERFEDGAVQLYNLAQDIGERNNLAAQEPDRVAQLRSQLHQWYREVDAKFLQPLPGGPEPWRPSAVSAAAGQLPAR